MIYLSSCHVHDILKKRNANWLKNDFLNVESWLSYIEYRDTKNVFRIIQNALFSCGATQYMVLCVCKDAVCPAGVPRFTKLYSPNLCLGKSIVGNVVIGLFASCLGLESPIHFKRFCHCDWRRLDWHSTKNASRSVCPWVLYSATSATRIVIFV